MCTTSWAECQTAITRCHDGLKQIKAVEAKAVNDCNALRQRCHQQIDRQLDDVEREIKATTRPLAAECTNEIRRLEIRSRELKSSKKLTQRIPIRSKSAALTQTQLQPQAEKTNLQAACDVPGASIQIPRLKVELDQYWISMNAVSCQTANRTANSIRCLCIFIHIP